MSTVSMRASVAITAGQAVRTTGSPAAVTPALENLRTRPFFGVALESVDAGKNVEVQTGGAFGALGTGVAGAAGVNSGGQLVRATDQTCASAPNWIGDCDAAGTVASDPVATTGSAFSTSARRETARPPTR